MKLSQQDIQVIRQYFADKPVKKAFIFGSYARNEADAKSDLDILVELDYTTHIGLGFVKMKLDLEDKLHRQVDLVSNQAVSQHLLPFINADKQLIYER
ncbi:MAG TPA: nucleotidyltransferase domain-containing protein [Chitinophaga sp.]|uniref:nucleotidyltransferase family protein n=1 Tax=Chitinophaga sp. TaxID=1869181 RepID=UPI002F925492